MEKREVCIHFNDPQEAINLYIAIELKFFILKLLKAQQV
jgi:hypothetical protein